MPSLFEFFSFVVIVALLVSNRVAVCRSNLKGKIIVSQLDDILADVEDENTLSWSLIALLNNVSAQLGAAIAAQDPAKIVAIINLIDNEKAAMIAAITANTPAQTIVNSPPTASGNTSFRPPAGAIPQTATTSPGTTAATGGDAVGSKDPAAETGSTTASPSGASSGSPPSSP